jgi:hypothetical protein
VCGLDLAPGLVIQFLLFQRLDAAFGDRVAIPVKCISGQAHHLARLRHIPKFLGQIEKAGFMTDDFFITL